MAGHIGLIPVPDDEELSDFIRKMIENDSEACDRHTAELAETIEVTQEAEEPEEFAYARMLNFLESLEDKDLIHLCAASLWRIHEMNKTPDKANLIAIQPETDKE